MNKSGLQKIFFAVFILQLFLLPFVAYAQPATPPLDSTQRANNLPLDSTQSGSGSSNTGTFTLKNPLKKVDSIGGLVQNFVEIFSYIVILFAVLMLIWTGLQFILARGNVEDMKKLKDQLLWIVVGVAVVIGARIIIEVVINTLSATGAVDPGIINSARDAYSGR